jgi:redox-sensitive bicupin YhaK (pirin superfamily)
VRHVLPAAAKQAIGPFIFLDHFGSIKQPTDANQDVRLPPFHQLSYND